MNSERAKTYRDTIRHAATLCGGIPALAARLHVAPALVNSWAEGKELPPTEVFLRAVDVVLAGKVDPNGA